MTDVMPISEVIDKVAAMCRANGVKWLELFGSYATGTATTSAIRFAGGHKKIWKTNILIAIVHFAEA